jgi:hypothetical protein
LDEFAHDTFELHVPSLLHCFLQTASARMG